MTALPHTRLYEGCASHSRSRVQPVPCGRLLRRGGQRSGQRQRAGRRRPLPQALRGAWRALRALLRRVEHLHCQRRCRRRLWVRGTSSPAATAASVRPARCKATPLGPRGQPKASGRACGALGWLSCCEQANAGHLDHAGVASGAARLLRTALSWSTLAALSRQPASPSRERCGALPRESVVSKCVSE